MTIPDFLTLPGSNNPVLCADGKVGILIQIPVGDSPCFVQVHGEDDARRIHPCQLTSSSGGALKQAGAPDFPSRPDNAAGILLSMDWASRGADFIL